MSSDMGRAFRSSLGAGFDAGLSAQGGGFDSDISGFDFTMVVLLHLVPPLAASPWKASRFVEQALEK
jgi:hypothetical protein